MGLFGTDKFLMAGAEAVIEDAVTVVVMATRAVEGPDADMEASAEGAPGKAEGGTSDESKSDQTTLRRFSPRLK